MVPTDRQMARVAETLSKAKDASAWTIPDGSLVTVAHRDDGSTWIEIIDPIASNRFVWDFGPDR